MRSLQAPGVINFDRAVSHRPSTGATMILSAFFCLLTSAGQAPADPVAHAAAFVTTLSRGDFAAAVADFDETMLKVLPADKLKTVWESVTTQFGPYQKQTGTRTETKDKLQIVFVTCQFEKRLLDVRLVFDADKKIAGLQI